MKSLKLFSLLVIAATLFIAGAASATTLTSPEGTVYTSTIKLEAEGVLALHGPASLACGSSIMEGKLEEHGASVAKGKVSSLTFTECGKNVVTVLKTGSLEIHPTSGGNGTVTWTGAEIAVEYKSELGNLHCIYTTNGTDLGTLTGSSSSNATLHLKGALIPRTGGSSGSSCLSAGEMTGSYKVTAPATLTVDAPPSPLTSPSGTSYTGTIKAEAESTELEGAFVTVKCLESTAEGAISTHTSDTAGGPLGSLAFGKCNYAVTVLKPGSLNIGTASGAVTSSGAEVSISTSVGQCVFTTNATPIGALTDSSVTGGAATLDLNSAKIPRTGGNFLCGASGTWTGSYKVTTPSTLYVDAASPVTSPEGTAYTSTLKVESSNFELEGAFVTIKCGSSSFEGKIETHNSTGASGNLSSLTFSGCNYVTTVLKTGSLKVDGTGTAMWSGAEITMHTSVGQCVFTTNNTDIGTITDSSATKSNAVIDIGSAKIPRTGGNFLCGASGTWTGSYKVTTPSTLYVDS